MNHRTLFDLAKPFLEKNDFGLEHTKRVYDIAIRYFTIPKNIQALTYSSIILHDIGGCSIKDQHQKEPKIAKTLLERLNYQKDFIRKICEIIKTHHNHPDNPSSSFRILYDSDKLVMFSPEEFPSYNSNSDFNWKKIINLIYTDKIKKLARKHLKNRESEKPQFSIF